MQGRGQANLRVHCRRVGDITSDMGRNGVPVEVERTGNVDVADALSVHDMQLDDLALS